VENFSGVTKFVSDVTEGGIDLLINGMLWVPPWLFIILITLLVWLASRTKSIAFFCLIGFSLILNLGMWEATISTLALVCLATLVTISIGLPLGVFAALNDTANKIIMPVLDFMQTMPAFVYLIPAIPFFGLGKVAAIFSTLIFAMPPSIRLTSLGIRQVPVELIEAADAFGSNKWQKLFKLQIPIATPTIMAGINQTIMLALSMVVIAAMIGAKGLGGEVWKAIQRLQPGRGFEAGLGIVIVAIVLDRVMQKAGKLKS
jgi:glycine betaine/proline transport system permease protein